MPQIVSLVGIVAALAYIALFGTSRADGYMPFVEMLGARRFMH